MTDSLSYTSNAGALSMASNGDRSEQLSFYANFSSQPDMCDIGWEYVTLRQFAERGQTFGDTKDDLLRMMKAERDRWDREIKRVEAIERKDLKVPPYDPAWDEDDAGES